MSSRTHSTLITDREKVTLDGALAKQRGSKAPENQNVSESTHPPDRQCKRSSQELSQQMSSKVQRGGNQASTNSDFRTVRQVSSMHMCKRSGELFKGERPEIKAIVFEMTSTQVGCKLDIKREIASWDSVKANQNGTHKVLSGLFLSWRLRWELECLRQLFHLNPNDAQESWAGLPDSTPRLSGRLTPRHVKDHGTDSHPSSPGTLLRSGGSPPSSCQGAGTPSVTSFPGPSV